MYVYTCNYCMNNYHICIYFIIFTLFTLFFIYFYYRNKRIANTKCIILSHKIINKYKFENSFLFNPSGMELSFDTLFSYIYSEYVFMLEEDWVVEKNIENEIFYPAFIM